MAILKWHGYMVPVLHVLASSGEVFKRSVFIEEAAVPGWAEA